MTDPRFPAREDCVLGPLLERRAAERGDQVYAVFESGEQWTYAETLEEVRRAASGLKRLGVEPGDRVLSWLPNGPDALRVWYGANYLGATYVPINTAYRGRVLEHVIDNSGAEVLVGHAQLLDRLAEVRTAAVSTVVAVGRSEPPPLPDGLTVVSADVITAGAIDIVVPAEAEPWDLQSIIYTSGTTGPSKGVLSSYLHLYVTGKVAVDDRFTDADRYMVNLPLFHAGGTLGAYAMLALGGSIAVVTGFETASFWDVVRSMGITTCTLLGTMATFLAKQPPTPDDRARTLRACYMVPLVEGTESFVERFGVDVYTLYNMTEVSSPILSDLNPTDPSACGKVRPGVEARIVDEFDREVPVGAVGELILRTDLPWTMNHGYNAMPDATAVAWRNGWFHTGDAFRRDQHGTFYFVDRYKDTIRRRGENISSFEVETELLAYPSVREAAAVAVASDVGEDEILALVAPTDGATIDPVELTSFLQDRLGYFMVPRYLRVLPELPKTPTNKVLKRELRQAGITADTWDREAAGIRLTRERFG